MEKPPPDILVDLMRKSKEQSDRRREDNSKEVFRAGYAEREPGERGRFRDALAEPGFHLIAEYKRCSPSEGEIRPDKGVIETIAEYDQGGAAAMSVLVEEERFGGSVELLKKARRITQKPLLWKG